MRKSNPNQRRSPGRGGERAAGLRLSVLAVALVLTSALTAGQAWAQAADRPPAGPAKLDWNRIFPPAGFAGESRRTVNDREPSFKSWAVFFDDQSLFAINAYQKASPESARDYVLTTAKGAREKLYTDPGGLYRGRIDLWRSDLAEGFRDVCEYRALEPGSFKETWYSTSIWAAVDGWVLMASVGAKYVGSAPNVKEVNRRHLEKMPEALEATIRNLVEALAGPRER
jgi:hypothetical protein